MEDESGIEMAIESARLETANYLADEDITQSPEVLARYNDSDVFPALDSKQIDEAEGWHQEKLTARFIYEDFSRARSRDDKKDIKYRLNLLYSFAPDLSQKNYSMSESMNITKINGFQDSAHFST